MATFPAAPVTPLDAPPAPWPGALLPITGELVRQIKEEMAEGLAAMRAEEPDALTDEALELVAGGAETAGLCEAAACFLYDTLPAPGFGPRAEHRRHA